MDVETILALDTSQRRVTVRKVSIYYHDTRLRLLVIPAIGKCLVVGYYFRYLDYENVTKKNYKTKTYARGKGWGVMRVYTEVSGKCVDELLEKVLDKNGIARRVWIVPTPICAMEDINDARYLRVGSTLQTEKFEKRKDNNVWTW